MTRIAFANYKDTNRLVHWINTFEAKTKPNPKQPTTYIAKRCLGKPITSSMNAPRGRSQPKKAAIFFFVCECALDESKRVSVVLCWVKPSSFVRRLLLRPHSSGDRFSTIAF